MHLPDQPKVNLAPIDYLVASELQAILKWEKQLQQRYESLLEVPSSEASEAWAFEVWRLKSRADRLARTLNALDQNYLLAPNSAKNTGTAAS